MRTTARFVAALGVVAAVVLTGCATTIDGTALPMVSDVAPLPSSGLPSSGLPSSGQQGPGSSAAPDSDATPTVPVTPETGSSGGPASGGPAASAPASSAPASSGSASTVYPTTPAVLIKTPRDAQGAALLEGRRIAGSLVVPTFIDPTLTGGSISTLPYSGPQAMTILFGTAPMPSVAQRAGMITGFSSSRSDSADNNLIVAAFEFNSPAQATAAVPLLAAAAANKADDKGKAAVPGFPAAAGWYGAFPQQPPYYHAFLAQGSLVLYVWVTGPRLNTPALQAAQVATALKVESAAMASYVPTAPAKLMQLPVDPAGIEAHTLLNADGKGNVTDGVMSGTGQLHYDSDPIGTQKLFAAAGVDLVSDSRASVYRAKDAGGAAIVRDGFVAFTQKSESGMTPYTLTAAVPGASCLQQALNSDYYCVGVAGRYAFEISASSAADINAAMLAQFTILKGF